MITTSSAPYAADGDVFSIPRLVLEAGMHFIYPVANVVSNGAPFANGGHTMDDLAIICNLVLKIHWQGVEKVSSIKCCKT